MMAGCARPVVYRGPVSGLRVAAPEGRLRWRSRRALLELDLVFERFWRRHTDGLEAEQAVLLEELLALEDHDLWDMLCGRQHISDPRWRGLVQDLIEV